MGAGDKRATTSWQPTEARGRQRDNCFGIKCRRGDLNPHDTKYRQILSLLRMPISPLRRRLLSTVYQNQHENPLVMSPICRLWRRVSSKVLPSQPEAPPGYF